MSSLWSLLTAVGGDQMSTDTESEDPVHSIIGTVQERACKYLVPAFPKRVTPLANLGNNSTIDRIMHLGNFYVERRTLIA